jgi:hypothetical protein
VPQRGSPSDRRPIGRVCPDLSIATPAPC